MPSSAPTWCWSMRRISSRAAPTPCTADSSATSAAINPDLKVIGLTATPYRLDSGLLHEGAEALFTDIAFEVSVRELIDQGYLAR